jgi:hypothetical protein
VTGLLDGRSALLGARGALLHHVDRLDGLGLDLADQQRDGRGGLLGLLGELADLLGDDGEAAALLAGARGLDRRVERQQVRLPAMPVIVSTMPPICSDFAPSWCIASDTCAEDSRTWRMASVAWATACSPSRATVRASAAACAVSSADCALARVAWPTSSVAP